MTEEMQDVDHTHPHTDESFGSAFRRGPTVAADGGQRGGADSDPEEEPEAEDAMEDVDHQHRSKGADRAFERGTEGRDESV